MQLLLKSAMFLKPFYSDDAGDIRITPQQASRFAKEVAGDFNPIHDPDAKRFCVPGDLLFSLVLERYGISQRMCFDFSGMVGRGVTLRLPESDAGKLEIGDDLGKRYLQVTREGEIRRDRTLTEALTRSYVAFSGHNFPDILVDLMAEHQVMINPDRPLVIYDTMSFELETLNFSDPVLELSNSELLVIGKRGEARLSFDINAAEGLVGSGFKKLLLSGLREYEHDRVAGLRDEYLARRAAYQAL